MTRFLGKVAVVTGAGSGIGRELALGLARRGARLALCDVDDVGLAATAERCTVLGAEVHTHHLDVSDRAAVLAYAEVVRERFEHVHQVYNNAGIGGAAGSLLESDWDAYLRVLEVNLHGVIAVTEAFLPTLVASRDGHVVNISSLNGYLAQAEASAYCASKFGVRGFSEALRAELRMARVPVEVSVVHPGGVRTNIATAALQEGEARGLQPTARQRARARGYNERLLVMPPAAAADIILRGVAAKRARIRVGRDAVVADLLVRLVPSAAPLLASRVVERAFR
jgi:short-subunit dehydrogenase